MPGASNVTQAVGSEATLEKLSVNTAPVAQAVKSET